MESASNNQPPVKRAKVGSVPAELIVNPDLQNPGAETIPVRFFVYNSDTKAWFLLVDPSSQYSIGELIDSSIILNSWDPKRVYKAYHCGKRYVRYPNGEVEMVMNMDVDYDDYFFEDSLDFCGCILQVYREQWLIDFPASFAQKVPARADGVPYPLPTVRNVYATIEFIIAADLEDLNYNGF